MEEQLRKNKLAMRLLATGLVLMVIIAIFVPCFKGEKVIETLGIKEKITVNISVFDMISNNDEIEVKSTSILGEFDEVLTTSMGKLMGDDTLSIAISFSFIALLISVVIYGTVLVFEAWMQGLQKKTISHFLISSLILGAFSVFNYYSISDTGFKVSLPLLFLVMILIVFILSETLLSVYKKTQRISIEIFFGKYKGESKEWFESFIKNTLQFMLDANMPIDVEDIAQMEDILDRREQRK